VERARLDAGRVVPIARPREERAAPPLSAWRKVPQNAATANLARFDAANAARDIDASRAQLADDLAVLHHPTGVEIGLEAAGGSSGPRMGAETFPFTPAPIATLGASLALSRACLSVDALATDDVAPFGAANIVTIALLEVDAHGRERRVEVFADDRLGDAVTRLYERYAELLPEGPERTRAGATAHAVAVMLGPFDLDRWAAVSAPDVEFTDSRNVGFGVARGAEAMRQAVAALLELSNDFTTHTDDVLGLRPDALLVGWRTT